MSRDQLPRMDVDTSWAYHRKVRRLQALYPERWPIYWCAYLALLAEAWKSGSRQLVLEDAWVPTLPCTLEEATEALMATGIVDKAGRVPAGSWREWYGPVAARLDAYAAAGRASGAARRERRSNGVATTHEPNKTKDSIPTTPTQPPSARGRARGGLRIDSGPEQAGTTLRSIGFYPPGEHPEEDQ